jgi:AraC-like DNA-binding protein
VENFVVPEEIEDGVDSLRVGPKGLWAVCWLHPQEWTQVVHVHARLEVGIVLVGLHEIHFPRYVARCRPGEVWFCAPWEPHGVHVAAPGTRLVVLRFHPQFLGEQPVGPLPWPALFLGEPEERPRTTTEEMRGNTLASGRLMCREILGRRPFWEEAVRFELLRLFLDLARDWQAPGVGARAVASISADGLARLMPALTLVHSALGRTVRAAEAAHACGLSVPGFHRSFRRVTGATFGQFRQRAQLSLAAHLLLSTARTVASIAAEAGFVDDSHLRRRFAAEYKCTPDEYRKRFRSPH